MRRRDRRIEFLAQVGARTYVVRARSRGQAARLAIRARVRQDLRQFAGLRGRERRAAIVAAQASGQFRQPQLRDVRVAARDEYCGRLTFEWFLRKTAA